MSRRYINEIEWDIISAYHKGNCINQLTIELYDKLRDPEDQGCLHQTVFAYAPIKQFFELPLEVQKELYILTSLVTQGNASHFSVRDKLSEYVLLELLNQLEGPQVYDESLSLGDLMKRWHLSENLGEYYLNMTFNPLDYFNRVELPDGSATVYITRETIRSGG